MITRARKSRARVSGGRGPRQHARPNNLLYEKSKNMENPAMSPVRLTHFSFIEVNSNDSAFSKLFFPEIPSMGF